MRRGVLTGVLLVLVLGGPEIAESLTGYGPFEQHTAFAFAPPLSWDVPLTHPSFDGDKGVFDILDYSGAGRIEPEATSAASRALLLALSDAWQAGAGEVASAKLAMALGPWPEWAERVQAGCGDTCPLAQAIEASRFLRLTPAMLAQMDQDGDGFVGRDEFLGAPRTSPHLLGTDGLGRDCLVRLFHGLRLSVVVGLIAAASASVFGVFYGAVAGSAGRLVGHGMMRLVDVLYGLPYIFLVILLISIVGPSTTNLLIAIACVQWLSMARTVRKLTASLMQAPYVEAARALGAHRWWILVHHVVPNARRPILTWAGLLVPASIKEEAFLSFLGLGVQAPRPSLGTLIAEGAPRLAEQPWLTLAPAAALFGVVLLVSVLVEAGEG